MNERNETSLRTKVRRVTKILTRSIGALAVVALIVNWLVDDLPGWVWPVAFGALVVVSLVDLLLQEPLPATSVRLVARRGDGGWDVRDAEGQAYDVALPRRWRARGDGLAVGDVVLARVDGRYQAADLAGWREPKWPEAAVGAPQPSV